MWWFHTTNERRMRHRLKQRLAAAQILPRNLRTPRGVANSVQQARQAFESADGDEITFREWFGEPLPEHWHRALRLETDLWVAIITTLADRKRPTSTEIVAMRAELKRITNLLTLEEQMLHSPLTKHFRNELERLQ